MVALNVDLGGVATYADLRDAIESLLPLNGWQRGYRLEPAVAVLNS